MSTLLEQYRSKRSRENELSSIIQEAIQDGKLEGLDLTTKGLLIESILSDLKNSDIKDSWSDKVRSQVLELLKLLGRNPTGSDKLYSKEGMDTLVTEASLQSDKCYESLSSVEALKCIANSLLLVSDTKSYFEDGEGIASCAKILQASHVSGTSRFLAVRILFFITIDRPNIVKTLVESQGLSFGLAKTLELSVSSVLDKHTSQQGAISAEMQTTEALKLFFNLALVMTAEADNESSEEAKQKEFAAQFKDSIKSILRLVQFIPLSTHNTLSSPLLNAIHALLHVPYSEDWNRGVISNLKEALTLAVPELVGDNSSEENFEQLRANQADNTLAPLLLVLRRAAANDMESRNFLAESLLPSENDRSLPVNKGDHISARLVRLMTSTALPNTRDSLCDLFYVLCDEDANKLSQRVGYGNAIGFLMNRDIPLQPPSTSQSNGPQEREVNPITGQFLDEENQGPSLADMTDEEKEREAERLFVLFERLKKTGVVDVENPIAKAMRESHGRVSEIDSEEGDD
ncbi:hypothetical protein INT43_007208 [Umbelopsis isabellina]|uniref:Guanine nucleotide exchange factor n=1 Tax=Mortierella isabellina TaxID=91625 RepID=A0A8H7Q043_MORIS|nr:hypothetical protein INT43_007208 [Umbelopsis isabellina]